MSVACPPEERERGGIEERGGSLRVSVYAGQNPVTGERVYLRETIKGTQGLIQEAKSTLGKPVRGDRLARMSEVSLFDLTSTPHALS